MAQPEQQLRYDSPVGRLARAREAERLAKNPPIMNPPPYSAEQMAKLSDLDRIQITYWQKNYPGVPREQIAANLAAGYKNGWLK